MANLIKDAIRCINLKSDQLEIIDAFVQTKDDLDFKAVVEEMIDASLKGNPRPIVIYGFYSLDRIKKLENGSVFDVPGVFYLKLPARLSEIQEVLQTAASFEMPSDFYIDHNIIRDLMVPKIRMFKHTCDNVWMSLSSNAHRAKKALDNSPDEKPRALSNFIPGRINKLLKDYKALEPSAVRIGIKGAERVAAMMLEAVRMTEQIQANHLPPQEAVDLAFGCAAEIKAVSEILAGAKELGNSG